MNTAPLAVRRFIAPCLIALALGTSPVLAQPDRPAPPPDRPTAPHDGPPPDRGPDDDTRERGPRDEVPPTPEQMRERIERRLEMVRGEESRLQRGLEMLNEGATPEDIYAFLKEGPGFDDRRPRHDRGPRGRGDGFDGPEGDVPEQFAPDMEPRVMKFLEDRDPEMFRRLKEARERDPERFNAMVRERWPKIREKMAKHMKDRGEQADNRDEIREIDRRAHELAGQARAAQGAERDRLLGELRASLDAQFELHAQNARREITMLQGRIASLTERLDGMLANRAQEIEDRVARMLEDKPPKSKDGKKDAPPPGDPAPAPSPD